MHEVQMESQHRMRCVVWSQPREMSLRTRLSIMASTSPVKKPPACKAIRMCFSASKCMSTHPTCVHVLASSHNMITSNGFTSAYISYGHETSSLWVLLERREYLPSVKLTTSRPDQYPCRLNCIIFRLAMPFPKLRFIFRPIHPILTPFHVHVVQTIVYSEHLKWLILMTHPWTHGLDDLLAGCQYTLIHNTLVLGELPIHRVRACDVRRVAAVFGSLYNK